MERPQMKFYQELAKVERVVNSCKTIEHYKVAKNMLKAMGEKYKYDLVVNGERGGRRKNERGLMVNALITYCDVELMKLSRSMGE
jgi:hypothetical protein